MRHTIYDISLTDKPLLGNYKKNVNREIKRIEIIKENRTQFPDN